MLISQKEYLERLKVFVETNLLKENKFPISMFNISKHWNKNKKQFDELLKEQGINVEKVKE